MAKVTQVIRYELDGELYVQPEKAEERLIDRFGEAFDGMLLEEGLDKLRYRKESLPLVLMMWKNREKLRELLLMEEEMIDFSNLCDCET